VQEIPHEKDVHFIRIDCFPLINTISKQADEWVSRYGEILREAAEAQVLTLLSLLTMLTLLSLLLY
jgi:type IV secretory pathway TrbF-like protein